MSSIEVAENVVLRQADERDATALATFQCSTGTWYEQEVETFVQQDAVRIATEPAESYRLLVVYEDNRLIACAGHHPEFLVRPDSKGLLATRLHLLAISRSQQGRELRKGLQLSDALMQTLIRDAMDIRDSQVLSAVVAQDNIRSMRMCERAGLRNQVAYAPRYVRLTAQFTPL